MTVCEDCAYCVYDEEYGGFFCEQDLDEDEFAALMERRGNGCPFYRPGNGDYDLAGKQ